jgi:PAS domain S-box-containing protein
VLLIEDSPGDARLMREFLTDSEGEMFDLGHVDNLTEGLQCLEQGNIGLVLLDLSLPDCHGLATFTKTKACAPDVPIIVLSGRDDEALAMRTVHEGAQDYLVKGQVDSRLLVRSMRYAIERKRAEEALAKERDLLHTLLNNLPDRIYFKDRNSRFIRISRAVAEQFKIGDPRDALGKSDHDFFLPEHAQAALADEQKIIRTGEPILNKIERETLPDGGITWALTSKLPLKNKRGRVVGSFGISRDITEIKQYEAALAAERNLLRNLIDNLPDYIYVKDREGRYQIDNIAHRHFLGVDKQEDVVGKTVRDFFPAEVAEMIAQDDLTVIDSGEPIANREEALVDRAGTPRWHATTKVPLRDAEGSITGIVGISRDITQRKLSEAQLRKANADLAQRGEQLQQTLGELQKSHKELKAAQGHLIEAEKMQTVGRLAAGVAHEVKNPLGILGMGVDYLLQNLDQADPTMALVLSDMKQAIGRADSIIMGLLDFSVPRDLEAQAEDLSALIEHPLTMVRHEMTSAPIQLVKELAAGLPKLWLDRNKIISVFVNVLTNAVHAMERGGTLTVRTYAKELQAHEADRNDGSRQAERLRAGDTVVVAEVMDTGTGIPEENLAQIFEPFFTTKAAGKGTGLGLTVTKRIVEMHRGQLEVRNRKEGGVIVTILFKA